MHPWKREHTASSLVFLVCEWACCSLDGVQLLTPLAKKISDKAEDLLQARSIPILFGHSMLPFVNFYLFAARN